METWHFLSRSSFRFLCQILFTSAILAALLQQICHQTSPARLVIGTEAGSIVAVEVFVEQQQIPWVWLIVCGPFDEEFTLLRPIRRHLGLITESPVIAYHHYEQEGLRRIPIQLEEVSTTVSKDAP